MNKGKSNLSLGVELPSRLVINTTNEDKIEGGVEALRIQFMDNNDIKNLE